METHIVIPLSGHVEILLKTSQLGVTNVGTIEEREKVEQGKEGQKVTVHLAEKLGGFLVGVDLIGSVLVERDSLLVVGLLDGRGLGIVAVLNVGLHD